MNDDVGGMNDLVLDDIVGDRQQRTDEDPVAFRALGQPAVAVDRGIGQLLGIEAALRAGRDDHRILDQLSLHQSEDFGTEVVAPVGPAQAAAGDRTAAQVDAFDARAVDPDLAIRNRRREARNFPGLDLECQRFGRGRSEGIGAQRRADHRPHLPQDAVVIDAPNVLQRLFELGRGRFDSGFTAARSLGVVRRSKQPDQRAGRLWRPTQGVDNGRDAECNAGLAHVTEPCAQPYDRPRFEAGI